MTSFYEKNWFEVNSETADSISSQSMFEWRVKSNEYENILIAQKLGYTLVESLVKFQTRIDDFNYEDLSEIRTAKPEDLEGVLQILDYCVINNNNFVNRFKNRSYFSKDQSEKYYKSSVENFFNVDDPSTMIASDDEGVYGFRIMKYDNVTEEYTGVMTGVLDRARGKRTLGKLQNGMSKIINKPYVENNATNLGNYAVIKNHMRQNRILHEIEHIFYKLNG